MVTISAAYGAGGALVAPRVAERLGVAFVDRAIPAAVAAQLAEDPEEVLAVEGELSGGASHWLAFFAPMGAAWTGLPGPVVGPLDEDAYRRHVAAVLAEVAEHGAVILGRGAQVVLADHPRALHVRLDGPVERRVAQAADLLGIGLEEARRAQRQTDGARHRYVQRLHHVHLEDPRLYHLWLDATVLPLATCVELVVAAAQGCAALRALSERLDRGGGRERPG
ncbi:cytidylate kinase-like family protein [Aciditerrimonas ferrireducens]|uniref:cytidylate kinase-like family protein n=1 Tax=Aciditerrimonas ferrireducens TaxID=667306 RepID=UPI002004463A|nr:cytidylate kinase-like family protein [Aciditerrimonas ferrireducens]MCK4177313.1 cytidylate kinase-like family protein [Aciditerrimonas ferrireducens]